MTQTIWTVPDLTNTLRELSRNYWWSWTPDGASLFRDLDPELWELSHHNPRRVLEDVSHHRLTQVATDPSYLDRVERMARRFRDYLASRNTWAERSLPEYRTDRPAAYFCAEFGIHESLPIYSGGLGILAGDHLKSASDLRHPARGGRPALPRGVLPPEHLPRLEPDRLLPHARLSAALDIANGGRRRPADGRTRRPARARARGPHLARERWAGLALSP